MVNPIFMGLGVLSALIAIYAFWSHSWWCLAFAFCAVAYVKLAIEDQW